MKINGRFKSGAAPVLSFALTAALSLPLTTVWAPAALADRSTETVTATVPMAPLQGSVEKMSVAEDQRYQAAIAKRDKRFKLTAEDIRDLQIGVTGIELVQLPGEDYAKVEAVVPGLPAALAGLKAGDLVVGGDRSNFWMSSDPTKEAWAFTGGRAGTAVEYRILRKGEIVSINVVRMNIEDIADQRLRKIYEDMACRLGPSGEGTVLLPSKSQAEDIYKASRQDSDW